MASRHPRHETNGRNQRAGRAWLRRLAHEAAGHLASPTAVAAEAMRTGLIPLTPAAARARRHEVPRDDEAIRAGDPDDASLSNTYVGEETPGGNNPTPDQNSVDDIGRAYGLQEEDTGALRSAWEVLERRDRRRSELTAPRRSTP